MLDEETNVFIAGGRTITLTNGESRVLGYLIENKHRCVTPKELSKMLGYSVNGIRIAIYDLRDKLGRFLNIKTRGYNIGYIVEYIGDTNDNKNTTNDKTKKE